MGPDEQRPAPPGDRWTIIFGEADDGDVIAIDLPSEHDAALRERWPPLGLQPGPPPPSRSVRRRLSISPGEHGDDATVDGAPSPGGWDRIESELALFASERLSSFVAVHAGVVLHEGQAILIPGVSGTGKSSLCLAALRAGAAVLSDEFALVDPTSGEVIGWQRPLRRRLAQGGTERLDVVTSSGPVSVSLVAALVYDPNAGDRWQPISRANSVLALLANTVCAQSRPDLALDAALAVVRRARAVAGTRGDADTTILRLLDEAGPAA